MKNAKRILWCLFALILSFVIVFSLASCDEVYTTEETDGMIGELNAAIAANKSDLEAKISATTAEYKAKDDALAAEIAADKAALAELEAKYASDLEALNKADAANATAIEELTKNYTDKVADLEKADSDNKAELDALKEQYIKDLEALNKADAANATAIEELTKNYTDKVAAIESSITAANSKIDANKAEFERNITTLSTVYDAKILEIKNLIEALKSSNDSQKETIKNLENYFNEKIAEINSKYTKEIEALLEQIEELKKKENYTVSFDTNGGGEVESQTVVSGEKAIEPAAPTKTGYDFLGWYLGDMKWEFRGYSVTESITLCAKWGIRGTDGLKYNMISANGIGLTVIEYVGEATEVVIPPSVNGFAVVAIQKDAFRNCTKLESITISDSVTSIGDSAFYGCTSLASVTIPDSVTSIGDSAFRNCTNLTSIVIPDSVTEIGDSAFEGCTSLTSISVSENNTSYKDIDGNLYTKDGKTLIQYTSGKTDTSFTIPDSVTEIGYGAFYGCTSLESITLPFVGATKDGTTNTHFGYVFGAPGYSYNDSYVPTSLKTVIITGGTSIAERVFYRCTSLESIIIPDSVTEIGGSAFLGCTSLESITLPFVGATKDGTSNNHFGYIFGAYDYLDNKSCVPTSLKTVIITGGTRIAANAFNDCTSLTSVTIPDSVTSIGDSAFEDCTNLTSISVSENNTSYKDIDGNLYTKDGKTLIQYTSGKTDTSFTIPDSVTSIGDSAFAWCTSLTSITIPDSVTEIGGSAFLGCTSLESITLPFVGATKDGTTNTHFGYVFGAPGYSYNDIYVPTSLKTVIITGGTSIAERVFYRCTSLESITIPDSVTEIGNYAFYNCASLTSIVIPDSVTSIGDSAFYRCTSLTDVYYNGTADEWNDIKFYPSNDELLNATIHFVSEE